MSVSSMRNGFLKKKVKIRFMCLRIGGKLGKVLTNNIGKEEDYVSDKFI